MSIKLKNIKLTMVFALLVFGGLFLGNHKVLAFDMAAAGSVPTVPSTMIAGQTYSATVSLQNTFSSNGSNWPANSTYTLKNVSGTNWGVDNIMLTTTVPTTSSATFNFTVTAPSTAATYPFQWEMANGGTPFSSPTNSVSITVTTSVPPPLTITMNASPTSINYGSSSIISWSSTSATSCNVNGLGTTSGSFSVSPTTTTTYNGQCSGPSGTVYGNATVNVTPPPPTNPVDSCVGGTAASISWTLAPGFTHNLLRVQKVSDSSWVKLDDDFVGNGYSWTATVGESYDWWVHTLDPNSGEHSIQIGHRLSCTSSLTINNVTISYPSVVADGSNQYNITISATDPVSAGNINALYALINGQGSSTYYRGYLTWYWGDAWPGYQDHHQCSGLSGTYAVVQPGFGNTYIHLDACNASDAGKTRTVTFTVRFDPSFTTPASGNDILGHACREISGVDTCVDTNFHTNFSIVPPPPPPTNPVGSCVGGTAASISWTMASGYTHHYLRVLKLSDNTYQKYDDDFVGNSYSWTSVPGESYNWWVHTKDTASGAWSSPVGTIFACTPPPPPTCSAATVPISWTVANSGAVRVTATGVANAAVVKFGTWDGVNGQDDLFWYAGINDGGGNWHADINLASHPGIGTIYSDVYVENNPPYSAQYCAEATLPRLNTGTINVNSNLPTTWTLNSLLTNPTNSYSQGTAASGGVYNSAPSSTYTITPATIPGYNWTVTPNPTQVLP